MIDVDAIDRAWERAFYAELERSHRWGPVKPHNEIDVVSARRFCAGVAAAAARHRRIVVWVDSPGGCTMPSGQPKPGA